MFYAVQKATKRKKRIHWNVVCTSVHFLTSFYKSWNQRSYRDVQCNVLTCLKLNDNLSNNEKEVERYIDNCNNFLQELRNCSSTITKTDNIISIGRQETTQHVVNNVSSIIYVGEFVD